MDLGIPEMLFIFFLALLLFGPKKLPEIGRQIGKALSEFKRASNQFKAQIDDEIRQLDVEERSRTIAAPAAPAAPEGSVEASPPKALAAASEPHTETSPPSTAPPGVEGA